MAFQVEDLHANICNKCHEILTARKGLCTTQFVNLQITLGSVALLLGAFCFWSPVNTGKLCRMVLRLLAGY